MRTIAGLIIGLGLGILLMYFSVSAFRVSGLAGKTEPAASQTAVGVVFGSHVPPDKQECVARRLREALPKTCMLRTAACTPDGIRETAPPKHAAGTATPTCILLFGKEMGQAPARTAFGVTPETPFVAYGTPPGNWIQCILELSETAIAQAVLQSLSKKAGPELRILLLEGPLQGEGAAADRTTMPSLGDLLGAGGTDTTVTLCRTSLSDTVEEMRERLQQALESGPPWDAIVLAPTAWGQPSLDALEAVDLPPTTVTVVVGCALRSGTLSASRNNAKRVFISPEDAVVTEFAALAGAGPPKRLPVRVVLRPSILRPRKADQPEKDD